MGLGEEEGSGGRAYRGRRDVYRWLRQNYELIEQWMAKWEPSGEELAARVSRAGVIGARGAPPTSSAVRKVWRRVCRDVKRQREREAAEQAARAAAADQRRHYPSRLPKGMRPQLAESGSMAADSLAEQKGPARMSGAAGPLALSPAILAMKRRQEEENRKWLERRGRQLTDDEVQQEIDKITASAKQDDIWIMKTRRRPGEK